MRKTNKEKKNYEKTDKEKKRISFFLREKKHYGKTNKEKRRISFFLREKKHYGKMVILVDADACPVVGIVEKTAAAYGVGVTLLCDTNHVLRSDYAEVKIIGAGADAVDLALVNLCRKGDIVVTQDYGVAAMALGKGAYSIHQSGRWYTNDNIETAVCCQKGPHGKQQKSFEGAPQTHGGG